MTCSVARQRADAIISEAKNIYVSACASEIAEAPELSSREPSARTQPSRACFTPGDESRVLCRHRNQLAGSQLLSDQGAKQDLRTGLVDYCPWRYGMINQWLCSTKRFDTALVMVSPPDANGKCSLGVQADFLPNFKDKIDRIIGFINPNLPRTSGHEGLDYKDFAAVVDYDVPVKTWPNLAGDIDADALRIAEQIVNLVPDGATVQLGLGQIPSAAHRQARKSSPHPLPQWCYRRQHSSARGQRRARSRCADRERHRGRHDQFLQHAVKQRSLLVPARLLHALVWYHRGHTQFHRHQFRTAGRSARSGQR